MQYGNDKNQQLRDDLRAYAHVHLHEHDEPIQHNYLNNKRSMNSKLFDQKSDIKSKNILDAEIKFNNQRSIHLKLIILLILSNSFISLIFYIFSFNSVTIGFIRFDVSIVYALMFLFFIISISVLMSNVKKAFIGLQILKGFSLEEANLEYLRRFNQKAYMWKMVFSK